MIDTDSLIAWALVVADRKLAATERVFQLFEGTSAVLAAWAALGLAGLRLVVERGSTTRNARTQTALVEAQTAVLLAAHRAGVPTTTIHSATWKAALGVPVLQTTRAVQKDAVRAAIAARFPALAHEPQDLCDAAGIALGAAAHAEVAR